LSKFRPREDLIITIVGIALAGMVAMIVLYNFRSRAFVYCCHSMFLKKSIAIRLIIWYKITNLQGLRIQWLDFG